MNCPNCKSGLQDKHGVLTCPACKTRAMLATDPKTKEKVIIWYKDNKEHAKTEKWIMHLTKKGLQYKDIS